MRDSRPADSPQDPDVEALRARIRVRVQARLRQTRAYAMSDEGRVAGAAWLARFGVDVGRLRR